MEWIIIYAYFIALNTVGEMRWKHYIREVVNPLISGIFTQVDTTKLRFIQSFCCQSNMLKAHIHISRNVGGVGGGRLYVIMPLSLV